MDTSFGVGPDTERRKAPLACEDGSSTSLLPHRYRVVAMLNWLIPFIEGSMRRLISSSE